MFRSHDQKIEQLAEIEPFHHLKDTDLKKVAAAADTIRLPAGKALITQGKTNNTAFVLISGEAEVSRNGVVVARLGPGAVIGEMGLLTQTEGVATVTLCQDSELLVMDGQHFLGVLAAVPEFALELLTQMAQRLRAMDTALADRIEQSS